MKKIILMVIMINIYSISFAQKVAASDVPEKISAAFKTKFPKAEKVTWEMDYENFVASFTNKLDISVQFDKDGNWLRTETLINSTGLPKSVKESISKEFAFVELSDLKFEDCVKVETPSKGLEYTMTISKGELKYDVCVSEKGEMIKKEEIKEEK